MNEQIKMEILLNVIELAEDFKRNCDMADCYLRASHRLISHVTNTERIVFSMYVCPHHFKEVK